MKQKKIIIILAICVFALVLFGITYFSRVISFSLLPPTPPAAVCPSRGCGGEAMCPTSLPADELASCQSNMTQAYAHALTMVNGTATALALSALPTPTASPTSTPFLTSTVWRVEPSVTPVTRPYEYLDISGVEGLPSFGLGRRWETYPPTDYDGDGKADIFEPSYTRLTNEQRQEFHQALLDFWETHAIVPDVITSRFAVVDALDLDLDHDGRLETVFAYHLGQNPSLIFGVAVMRDGQVLDSTPLDWKGDYVKAMHLIGVPLSSDQTALLAHLTTVTAGSGIHPKIYRRLMLLEEDELRIVWDWDYYGGARAGAAFRQFQEEQIRFAHLTSQTKADILLSRKVEQLALTSDNPENYINYGLQFPGELVFSWVTKEYRLTHFYDRKKLIPIRPLDFIVYTPKINIPFRLDEDYNDWSQIEYKDSLTGFGAGLSSRSPGLYLFRVAWDETSLYLDISAEPDSSIWVGLDTDLQGDFDSHLLNEDDHLFHFQLKNDLDCTLTESASVHPRYLALRAKSVPPGNAYGDCFIEAKIPLSDLRISSVLVSRPGFVLRPLPTEDDYMSSNFPLSQYFPAAGEVMGFTVFSESQNTEGFVNPERFLPFVAHDPATWGTLIFTSDR